MNRRKWIGLSATAAAGIPFAAYKPYVLSDPGAYDKPGEFLRLHWNENPYGPSPMAIKAARETLVTANLYPDDKIEELTSALCKKYGLSSQQLMISAGSTEILSLLGQTAHEKEGDVLMSTHSFPTLAIFAEGLGTKIRTVPIGDQDQLHLSQLSKSINDQTALVFVCNPNNPTSTYIPKSEIIEFCESVPERVLICLDEAYIQFSPEGEGGSLADQLSRFPNLVICRTFSKAYGLAGMRLGYAMASEDIIRKLRSRHLGFGMANSRIGVAAAISALEDEGHLKMVVDQNSKGRSIVYDAFDRWGIEYAVSATNFIYARSNHFDRHVRTKLLDDKIRITKWPSMNDHIRISIGKPEWMETFVEKVEKYLV